MTVRGQIVFNQQPDLTYKTNSKNLSDVSLSSQNQRPHREVQSEGDRQDRLRRRAKEEVRQEIVKEEEKNRSKLDILINKANAVLIRIKNVFPFDFFPNEIVVNLNRVNILRRQFFFDSGEVETLPIEDIGMVILDSGPFFSTLRLKSKTNREREIKISYLWKDEAIKARRIIEGLILASKENINFEEVDANDLSRKIEKLGETQESA